MKTVYSRKSIELIFANNSLENTAVISFYDPDRCNADSSYKLVDYSGKADDVLYVPLEDFQTKLPEADKIAKFVYSAESKGMGIICQCESGQNRSAGCASAILEHFNKSGDLIFNDDRYYPDEIVYFAVLQALETFRDN